MGVVSQTRIKQDFFRVTGGGVCGLWSRPLVLYPSQLSLDVGVHVVEWLTFSYGGL